MERSSSKLILSAIAAIASFTFIAMLLTAFTPQIALADRPPDAVKSVIYNGYKYRVEIDKDPVTGNPYKEQGAWFLGPINKKKSHYTVPNKMKFKYGGQTLKGQVVNVNKNSFKGCTKAKTITFKWGGGEIASKLFADCKNLRIFKSSVPLYKIGKSAFSKCKKLQTFKTSKGIKEIGSKAFCNCKNLRTFVANGVINEIGPQAFSGCTKLKAFNVKKNVRSVSKMAFYKCARLKTFVLKPIPASLIGEKAFYGCADLQSFVVKGTTDIGVSAFQNCINLKSFEAQYGIREIRARAFLGCPNLDEFECKDGFIEKVGVSAFENCKKLSSFPVMGCEGGETEYNNVGTRAFYGCTELTAFSINCGKHNWLDIAIGNEAFSGCTRLNSLSFGGNRPSTGTWIAVFKENAFKNCTSLSAIVNLDQINEIYGKEAFAGTPAYQQVVDQIEKNMMA